MKLILKISLLTFWVFTLNFFSCQQVPNISINDLSGNKLNISKIDSSQPVVLSFWATWCLPCLEELNAISEKYDDWKKEANFSMYAISTDDARTSSKVKTIVKSKGWAYEILFDPNQNLKRALNINTIPHTVLIHKGKIVYSHVGYSPGDEDELIAKIKECYRY